MLAKFKSEKMKSFIFMATLMVLLITAGMISSALVSDVATQEDPKIKLYQMLLFNMIIL